ncbi:MAG: transposase [Dehalococcoidia bacterium]|nr:transposase [Dehalococcoidia bacterium]
MSDYHRVHLDGGTFFFTAVTHARRSIFQEASATGLLKKSFRYVMVKRPFLVDAIVILPDHVHCIWTLPLRDGDFSVRWRLLKTYFSRHYCGSIANAGYSASMASKKEVGIWQRRFWEHTIRDQEDFNSHCDYIHYNPVKHGLVKSPGEWKDSSFRKFVEKGMYPPDWGQDATKALIEMNFE